MKILFLRLFFGVLVMNTFLFCSGQTKTDREIDNLVAFAKAYGYVKYFHPSSESEQVDWGWFSVYGAQKVLQCQDQGELIQTLQRLFNPIAPTVTFSSTAPDPMDFQELIQPKDTTRYLPVYWQHRGVTKDMAPLGPVYRSVRVNSLQINTTESTGEQSGKAAAEGLTEAIFEGSPDPNEIWIRQIGDNLWMGMPLVLQLKAGQTYPESTVAIEKFMTEGEPDTPEDASSLAFRCGNLINAWNVFQHFYPYFTEMGINWQQELKNSLSSTYSSDKATHIKDLKRLTAALKDNHVTVSSPETEYAAPPFDAEWIEGKLVVTAVYAGSPDLKVGDVIKQIDGKSCEELFGELRPLVSAATEGWYSYLAPILMLTGKENSTFSFTVGVNTYETTRLSNYYRQKGDSKPSDPGYRFLDDDVAYLNLDVVSMDTITKLMPRLKASRAIIADVRGYPNSNHGLINHLLSKKDERKWMHVDHYLYPDQENKAGTSDYGWEMEPKKPYLGDKKIVFITDGRAVSYAESYLGFIDGYGLGTLIGQPSSGTNGNVNRFDLPGEYRISFTGMRVLKQDGSQLHGIGFLPQVYVDRTIAGVKAGRDEYLEKAIELVR
ncbi:S41 family peptidase [Algoriphagus terrigena]|uniref:S41 family peptidase n=1 Tax=Algoriphagus terrigena TaxID=344884 RepID=UPI000403BF2C|nr:S41 family peptidase [Algoriphagus terrigena]